MEMMAYLTGTLTGIRTTVRTRLCRMGMTGAEPVMEDLLAAVPCLYTALGSRSNEVEKMSTVDLSSLGVRLHDAEISAIRMDRENSMCRLDFLHVDGIRSFVELSGVRAYRVQDYVVQNVVSRVLRSGAKDFSVDDLRYWVAWVTSLSDAPSWLKPDRLDEWLTAIKTGRFELVVFEPSAGAQIAAIFERMTLQSIPT